MAWSRLKALFRQLLSSRSDAATDRTSLVDRPGQVVHALHLLKKTKPFRVQKRTGEGEDHLLPKFNAAKNRWEHPSIDPAVYRTPTSALGAASLKALGRIASSRHVASDQVRMMKQYRVQGGCCRSFLLSRDT